MGSPDTTVELADGRLVCKVHRLQICRTCYCDYTFTDETSNQPSSSDDFSSSSSSQDEKTQDLSTFASAVPVLYGSAARFLHADDAPYCPQCNLTWTSAQSFHSDISQLWEEECPIHDSLPGTGPQQRTLVIHIDGACSRNGSPHATGGIGVFFALSSPYNIIESLASEGSKPVTSQRAELTAAIRALQTVREKYVPARCKSLLEFGINPCHRGCWDVCFGFRVVLATDSAYVVECMTSHLLVWRWDEEKKVYYNRKSGKLIMNSKHMREIVEEVELLAEKGVQVMWQKVPREQNLLADRMAKKAATAAGSADAR